MQLWCEAERTVRELAMMEEKQRGRGELMANLREVCRILELVGLERKQR